MVRNESVRPMSPFTWSARDDITSNEGRNHESKGKQSSSLACINSQHFAALLRKAWMLHLAHLKVFILCQGCCMVMSGEGEQWTIARCTAAVWTSKSKGAGTLGYRCKKQADGSCWQDPTGKPPCEVIKKPPYKFAYAAFTLSFFFFLIVLQAICTYHNQRGLCTCGRHPKNHSFSFHWPRAFIPLLQKRFLEQTHRSHMLPQRDQWSLVFEDGFRVNFVIVFVIVLLSFCSRWHPHKPPTQCKTCD